MNCCPACGRPLAAGPAVASGTVSDLRASLLCGDRIPRMFIEEAVFTESELLAAGWKKNIATGDFRRSLFMADNAACERG